VNDKNFFFLSFTAPIFAACKRRIYHTKIVRILLDGYSKRQIYLSFTIELFWQNLQLNPPDISRPYTATVARPEMCVHCPTGLLCTVSSLLPRYQKTEMQPYTLLLWIARTTLPSVSLQPHIN